MSHTPEPKKVGGAPSSSPSTSSRRPSRRQPKKVVSDTSTDDVVTPPPPSTKVASRPLGTTTSPSSFPTHHHNQQISASSKPFQHLFSQHHPTVPHSTTGPGGHLQYQHHQHLSITVGGGDGGTRRPLSPLSLSSSLGVGSSSESQSATIPLHSSSQFPHNNFHHHRSSITSPTSANSTHDATTPSAGYPHHSYTRHFLPTSDTVPHTVAPTTTTSTASSPPPQSGSGERIVSSIGRSIVQHHQDDEEDDRSAVKGVISPTSSTDQYPYLHIRSPQGSPSHSDLYTSEGGIMMAVSRQGSGHNVVVPMLESQGADSFARELPLPMNLASNQSSTSSCHPSATSTLLPPLSSSSAYSTRHHHHIYDIDSLFLHIKVEIRVNSNRLSSTSDFLFPVSQLTSPSAFMRTFVERTYSGKTTSTTSPGLGGSGNLNAAFTTSSLLTPVNTQLLGSRSSESGHLQVSPSSYPALRTPDMSLPVPSSSTLEHSCGSYKAPNHAASFEIKENFPRRPTSTPAAESTKRSSGARNPYQLPGESPEPQRQPPALNTRARFLMNSLDCCRPLLTSSGTSELRIAFRYRSSFVVPRWAYDIVVPNDKSKRGEHSTVVTTTPPQHLGSQTIPYADHDDRCSPTSASTPPPPQDQQQLPPFVQLNNNEKCSYVLAMKAIQKGLQNKDKALRQASAINKKEAASLRQYRLNYLPYPVDIRQWLPPSCYLTVELPSVLQPSDGCHAPPATPLHRTSATTTPYQTTTAPSNSGTTTTATTTTMMTPPPQQLAATIPGYLPPGGPFLSRSSTPVATHTSTTSPRHGTSDSLDTSERRHEGDIEYSCEDDFDAVRSALSFETHKAPPPPHRQSPPPPHRQSPPPAAQSDPSPIHTSPPPPSTKKGVSVSLGPLSPYFTVAAVTVSNPPCLRRRLRSQSVDAVVSEGFLILYKLVCVGSSSGGSPSSFSHGNAVPFHPVSFGTGSGLLGPPLDNDAPIAAVHHPHQPPPPTAPPHVELTTPHSPGFASFAPFQYDALSYPPSEGPLAVSSWERHKPTSLLPYHQRLFVQHLLEIIRQESSSNPMTSSSTTHLYTNITPINNDTAASRINSGGSSKQNDEFGGFRQYSHPPNLKHDVEIGKSTLRHAICHLNVVLSSSELNTSFTDASRTTSFSMANLALVFMQARALPFFEFAVCHLTQGTNGAIHSVLDLVPAGYHEMSLSTCFNPNALPQSLDYHRTSSSISYSDSTTPVDHQQHNHNHDSNNNDDDDLPSTIFGKSPLLPPLLVRYGMPERPTATNIDNNHSAVSMDSTRRNTYHHNRGGGLMRGVPTTSDVEECEDENNATEDNEESNPSSTEGASSTRHVVRPSPHLSGYHHHSHRGGGDGGITAPLLRLTPSGSLHEVECSYSCDSDVTPKQRHIHAPHHHPSSSSHQQHHPHSRFRQTSTSSAGAAQGGGGGRSSSRGTAPHHPLSEENEDEGDSGSLNTFYHVSRSRNHHPQHRLLSSNTRLEEALYVFLTFMMQIGKECGIWTVVYSASPTPPPTSSTAAAATEDDAMGERQLSTTSTALPPSLPPTPPIVDSTMPGTDTPTIATTTTPVYVSIASRSVLRQEGGLSRKRIAIAKRIRLKCLDAFGALTPAPIPPTPLPSSAMTTAGTQDDDGDLADAIIIIPFTSLCYFQDFIDYVQEVTNGMCAGYTEVSPPTALTATATVTSDDGAATTTTSASLLVAAAATSSSPAAALSSPVGSNHPTDNTGTLFDTSFWRRMPTATQHHQLPTLPRSRPRPTTTGDNDAMDNGSMVGGRRVDDADDSVNDHDDDDDDDVSLPPVHHARLGSELVSNFRRARRRVREFEKLILGLLNDPHWEVVYDPWHPILAVRPELGTTTSNLLRTSPSTQPSHHSTNFSQSFETEPGILSPHHQNPPNQQHYSDPCGVPPVGAFTTFPKRQHNRVFVPHPGPSCRGRGGIGHVRGRSSSLSALSSCSTVLTTGQNSLAGGGSSTTTKRTSNAEVHHKQGDLEAKQESSQ